MRCEVLLFAQLAEAIDAERIAVELPDDATVGVLLETLGARHEAIGALQGKIAVAVDERYAGPATPLRAGQTIALIPPVSGG